MALSSKFYQQSAVNEQTLPVMDHQQQSMFLSRPTGTPEYFQPRQAHNGMHTLSTDRVASMQEITSLSSQAFANGGLKLDPSLLSALWVNRALYASAYTPAFADHTLNQALKKPLSHSPYPDSMLMHGSNMLQQESSPYKMDMHLADDQVADKQFSEYSPTHSNSFKHDMNASGTLPESFRDLLLERNSSHFEPQSAAVPINYMSELALISSMACAADHAYSSSDDYQVAGNGVMINQGMGQKVHAVNMQPHQYNHGGHTGSASSSERDGTKIGETSLGGSRKSGAATLHEGYNLHVVNQGPTRIDATVAAWTDKVDPASIQQLGVKGHNVALDHHSSTVLSTTSLYPAGFNTSGRSSTICFGQAPDITVVDDICFEDQPAQPANTRKRMPSLTTSSKRAHVAGQAWNSGNSFNINNGNNPSVNHQLGGGGAAGPAANPHHPPSRSKRSSRHPLGPALNTNLKPRARQGSANDPQSIAARQRRERINTRLKALQELVPNGSKMDLVTMLEKAINYVKFLQLQLKVLTNDEYWHNAQQLADASKVLFEKNTNEEDSSPLGSCNILIDP